MALQNQGLFFVALVAVLILAIMGAQILLAPMDFWDGRILSHAFETGELDGVWNWFTESGWFVQLGIIVTLESFLGPLTIYGLRFLSVIALCGIAIETYKFARGTLQMTRTDGLFVAAATSAFPAWSALLSSVLFIYVLCVWLVLLAVRLIMTGEFLPRLAGSLLLLLSLDMSSNHVFSIALAAVYATCSWRNKDSRDPSILLYFGLVTVISVGAFFVEQLLFEATGLYANYNHISISELIEHPTEHVVLLTRFFSYPIAAAVIVVAASFAVRVVVPVRPQGVSHDSRMSLWPILVGLFLVGAAAFPYVIVGKGTDIRVLDDWSPRHAFLAAMPVAVVLVGLGRAAANRLKIHPWLLAQLPIICTILAFLGLQGAGTWIKLSRGAYETGIIQALSVLPPPPPGTVQLVAPSLPGPRMRFYEVNWLMFQGFGREDWFANAGQSEGGGRELPGWAVQPSELQQIYKVKHIMQGFTLGCDTMITVLGPQYTVRARLAWLIWGDDLIPALSVEIDTQCDAN
ncbi:MAG: hypothetical protein JJ897_11635 [Marinibacterium sp.]|nr:hypothetical protein [Marinibacterium sp.]